jgi:hypothetical protein
LAIRVQGAAGTDRRLQALFVVGAPRCGTTFVAKLLARHPKVCFSKPKETHVFVRTRGAVSPPAYLRRYHPHLHAEHRVIAEGSPSSLYSPEALQRILALDPEARFVVCIRNPVEMASSYHARMLYTLDEEVRDFAEAWSLQPARARGERIPKRCRDPRMLQYGAICRIGAQLERMLGALERERLFVTVFDDLVDDPVKIYRGLLDFAGLDYDARTAFTPSNQHREFERAWLQSYLVNPPRPIAAWIDAWERRGWGRPSGYRWLRKRLKSWNTRRTVRPPLAPPMRETLRAAFASDVERLSDLLGRDLSHWQ